jgi:hypothetical protein
VPLDTFPKRGRRVDRRSAEGVSSTCPAGSVCRGSARYIYPATPDLPIVPFPVRRFPAAMLGIGLSARHTLRRSPNPPQSWRRYNPCRQAGL